MCIHIFGTVQKWTPCTKFFLVAWKKKVRKDVTSAPTPQLHDHMIQPKNILFRYLLVFLIYTFAGIKGSPGMTGFQGMSGDPGQTGLSGEKGLLGMPGQQGNKGDMGPQGPKGSYLLFSLVIMTACTLDCFMWNVNNSVLELIIFVVNNFFSSGERGVMGPPGQMSGIELEHMKEVMKGAKGEHGDRGSAGFTGPRGTYCCYNYLLSWYESEM